MDIKLNNSWQKFIEEEEEKAYFIKLMSFMDEAYKTNNESIFPAKNELLKAFSMCSIEDVSVVILGQDPYPTRGYANGLCFSVNEDVKPFPKSLKNIFTEIENDLRIPSPENGNLERWAKQGVLLLNNVLSVVEGKPDSHAKKGWEQFTSAAIHYLGKDKQGLVYLLWGSKAQEKAATIDADHNLILKSVHPSPLSAYRGFFGCKHFSKTNEYLITLGKNPINW
jgi:uracil-DNA glycosylase